MLKRISLLPEITQLHKDLMQISRENTPLLGVEIERRIQLIFGSGVLSQPTHKTASTKKDAPLSLATMRKIYKYCDNKNQKNTPEGEDENFWFDVLSDFFSKIAERLIVLKEKEYINHNCYSLLALFLKDSVATFYAKERIYDKYLIGAEEKEKIARHKDIDYALQATQQSLLKKLSYWSLEEENKPQKLAPEEPEINT